MLLVTSLMFLTVLDSHTQTLELSSIDVPCLLKFRFSVTEFHVHYNQLFLILFSVDEQV
jgi:hypothetical protein